MAVTPTGNPAWVRTNSHTAYGGHINKTNFQSVGTVNPRTDLSAENLCRMAADLAAVARTAPFAVLTFTCDDATPADPTVNDYSGMVGSAPTGTRNSDGDVSFAWNTSYEDPYSQSANTSIIGAVATVHAENGTYDFFATTEIVNAYTVRVRVFESTGVAVTNPKVTLTVY